MVLVGVIDLGLRVQGCSPVSRKNRMRGRLEGW
jgi:hypothetical protein